MNCEAGNRTITASWATATTDEASMTARAYGQPAPRTYVVQLGGLQPQLPQAGARSVQQALDAQEDQAARMQGVKVVHHDMSAADEAAADRERATLQRAFDETDRLMCSLPIDVAHETYTSRSFEVAMSEGFPIRPSFRRKRSSKAFFPSRFR